MILLGPHSDRQQQSQVQPKKNQNARILVKHVYFPGLIRALKEQSCIFF